MDQDTSSIGPNPHISDQVLLKVPVLGVLPTDS